MRSFKHSAKLQTRQRLRHGIRREGVGSSAVILGVVGESFGFWANLTTAREGARWQLTEKAPDILVLSRASTNSLKERFSHFGTCSWILVTTTFGERTALVGRRERGAVSPGLRDATPATRSQRPTPTAGHGGRGARGRPPRAARSGYGGRVRQPAGPGPAPAAARPPGLPALHLRLHPARQVCPPSSCHMSQSALLWISRGLTGVDPCCAELRGARSRACRTGSRSSGPASPSSTGWRARTRLCLRIGGSRHACLLFAVHICTAQASVFHGVAAVRGVGILGIPGLP